MFDTIVQILVELAELQDQEVGDGTTSVVIVAAEILKRANDLVRNKIHPTSIISGFRLAMREVCSVNHATCIPVHRFKGLFQSVSFFWTYSQLAIRMTSALQACKFIEENLSMKVETLGKETLINCAKTAMSSKIVGSESDFFSQLVVDAVTAVKTQPRGDASSMLVSVSRLVCFGQACVSSPKHILPCNLRQ